MLINEIKVMRRRNLGNYEHKEVTIGAALTEDSNLEETLLRVNNIVRKELGMDALTTPVNADLDPQEDPATPEKKVSKKKVSKKKVAKKDKKMPEYTLADIQDLCKTTAQRLGSAEKIKVLVGEVCGTPLLKDADPKTYKALADRLEAVE